MTPPTEERRAELRAKAERLEPFHPALAIELLDHITALEAALRPFARFAGTIDPDEPDDYQLDYGVGIGMDASLFTGDFRRAASLLPGEGNA